MEKDCCGFRVVEGTRQRPLGRHSHPSVPKSSQEFGTADANAPGKVKKSRELSLVIQCYGDLHAMEAVVRLGMILFDID